MLTISHEIYRLVMTVIFLFPILGRSQFSVNEPERIDSIKQFIEPIEDLKYQNTTIKTQLDSKFSDEIKTNGSSLELKDSLIEMKPDLKKVKDTLKNQINMNCLYIDHDENLFASSILSVEYIRKQKRNTFVGRLNMTQRDSEFGFQGDFDWYHVFKNSNYFLVNVAVSDQFFPKYKAGFSYYYPIPKIFQLELGTRYFYDKFEDQSLFFGILGSEREVGRFWLNLRYTFRIDEDFRSHLSFQSRMFLNKDRNYFSFLAGYGNIPEANDLNYLAHNEYSITNVMLGGGYLHNFSSQIHLSFLLNWYRYQVRENTHSNQYHAYVSIGYKF